MKIRFIAFTAVAVLAASSAFAATPDLKAAEERPAHRAQLLLEDVAAGMREVLAAVTPEVSLPKIEVKLPPLDRAPR